MSAPSWSGHFLFCLFFPAAGCRHKPTKQGVRTVGTALEFRMELNSHKEGVSGDLHRFYQPTVGRLAAEPQSSHLQLGSVLIIELVAVTVALVN